MAFTNESLRTTKPYEFCRRILRPVSNTGLAQLTVIKEKGERRRR